MTPNKADAMSHPGFIYPVKPAPSHGRDTINLSNMVETCGNYMEEISQRDVGRAAMLEVVVVGGRRRWEEGTPLLLHSFKSSSFLSSNFKMRPSTFWGALSPHPALLYS